MAMWYYATIKILAMAKAREFIALVDERGKIPRLIWETLVHCVSKVPGKRVRLTISVYRKKRSNQQNAFYFGVVVPLVRNFFLDKGNNATADEIHIFIKTNIWKHVKKFTLPNGDVVTVPDTSTKFTTAEWEDKMDLIRSFFAEFDLIIPYPHEGVDYGSSYR